MTDDAEWHAWRGKGIGGSDIAAVCGLSNYDSPYSLWCRKVGLLEPSPTTERQRIGQVMEQALNVLFHERTGLHIGGEQTWCVSQENETWRCTVDGFAFEGPTVTAEVDDTVDFTDALGVVQHKTDGRFGWPGGPPANIRAQCIWEMGVTGLPHAWLSVMFAGFRYEVFELDWSDPDVQSDWAFMTQRAVEFWQHVVSGTPPPIDGTDATSRALSKVFANPNPDDVVEADDELRGLIVEYDAIGRHLTADKKRRDAIGNAIRLRLGPASVVVDGETERGDPRVICTWNQQTTESYTVAARTNRVLRVSVPKSPHPIPPTPGATP